MREVRMTFGQHLEELRKRILFALLYVVVGVVVALAIEKPLMQITLKPHQQAFRKAQKKKLLERLDTHLEDLRAIGVSPDDSGEGGRFSDTDWQVLFKGEVKRKAVLRELSAPFESFAGKLEQLLPSLPQEERALFEEAYREQGASLAAAIDERFATLGEFESVSEIPRRFKTLENNLRALKKDSVRTDDFLLGGWGEDLEKPIRELEEFNQSLDSRREKVSASELTIEKLEEVGSDSEIEAHLLGSLRGLDEIVEGMQATEEARIMVISYLEQFYTHLKVAIIFGLLLTFPFVLYEAWKFVGAGLYKSEQRYVLTFLPFSMALFALGAFFGYTILIPVALTFLATWGGLRYRPGVHAGQLHRPVFHSYPGSRAGFPDAPGHGVPEPDRYRECAGFQEIPANGYPHRVHLFGFSYAAGSFQPPADGLSARPAVRDWYPGLPPDELSQEKE